MKRDIVYILGTGSLWQNNELRYSLRSLENIEHGKVFIVGWKPAWLTTAAIHIHALDAYHDKLSNSIAKQIIAATDWRITDEFILMNDDFFILKPQEIKNYYLGPMAEHIDNHETRGGYYYNALRRTRDVLRIAGIEQPLDYEAHTPIIYKKDLFLKLAEKIDCQLDGYLFRSLYGNLYNIGGEKIEDFKIRVKDGSDWHKWDTMPLISTDNEIAAEFRLWIREKLSEPSIYELPQDDNLPPHFSGDKIRKRHFN